MFGKIFCQFFDSSIVEESINTRYVWMSMIALADSEGMVDLTVRALARRINIPVADLERSLAELMAKDPHSRSDEEEGRRLVLIDEHRLWGWRLVNYATYRNIASEEQRRARACERQRRSRANRADVTPGHALSRMSRHTDTDADSEEEAEKETPPPTQDARAQPPAGPPNPKPVANGRPPDVGGDAGHAISAWDRFWAAYPLKAAELEGQRAFSEVFDDLPPIDDLLKILADQIGANAETGKEWKLHAKNWLRNKRWRDEIVRRERPEVLQARIEALTQVRGMARQYPDQVPAGRAMILRELPPLLRRADLKAEIRPDLSLDEWGKVANMADSALVAARAALAALPRQLQAVAHG